MDDEREQVGGPADALRREAGPAPEFALVRPFVDGAGRAHGRTRQRSVVTADSADATQEIPITQAYERVETYVPHAAVDGRSLFLPLILAAAVVLAGGVLAVYLMTAWSGPGTVTVGPAQVIALPAETPSDTPSPTATPTATVTDSVDTTAPGSGTHPHAATHSTSAATPSPSPSTAFTSGIVAPLPSPSPSPTDSFSPLPAAPVTGQITGIGGLCVDDRNRISDNGTAIQIYGCNGTPAQDWTMQPDATVRVLGKCMQPNKPAAGAAVVQWDCSGDVGQAWRRGPSNSLVNVASGLCLDDPNSSQAWTTQLDIAVCNGAANQSWNVPH